LPTLDSTVIPVIFFSGDSQELISLGAVCIEVVNNFAGAGPAVANPFFQQYFLCIVQDIFFVLTDTDHKSGFKLQSLLLARMFQLVEMNQIQTQLFDPATVADPSVTNALFLREYTANLLKNAFPHVSK
jgi:exportin-1